MVIFTLAGFVAFSLGLIVVVAGIALMVWSIARGGVGRASGTAGSGRRDLLLLGGGLIAVGLVGLWISSVV